MLFRNYEKPEGWSVGQPEVLVARETIQDLGMPTVQHDSLTDMLEQIAGKQVSTIKIHTIPVKQRAIGYVLAYSNTMHVDAIASEATTLLGAGTVTVVAHEAQHIGDFRNRPFRAAFETLSTDMLYAGILASKAAFPNLPPIKPKRVYDPLEKRAYATEADLDVLQHGQDILFPQSERTKRLLISKQLTLKTIQALGLDGYADLASDYVKPENWFSRLFFQVVRS